MITFVVHVRDIVTDLEHPIDWSALSDSEAAELVRSTYNSFSPFVEVAVVDGIATITFREESDRKTEQALGQIRDASRAAGAGNYNQAIKLYQQALKVLPTHTVARREMAMAMMEVGQNSAAKDNLIRVLQLDHKDAWAYQILGNLYFRVEQDLGSAERYYALAADLEPDDPYILNSYAALLAKRGKNTEAVEIWERIAETKPNYPNPYYGLAMVYGQHGDTDKALEQLSRLLALPLVDPRNNSLYEQARRIYTEIRARRAAATADDSMQRVRSLLASYEETTGIPIRLEEEPSLSVDAKVELAWRYARPYHRITYKLAQKGRLPSIIAHEFEHITLESQARNAGKNRHFATTDETIAEARHSVERDTRKLRSRFGDQVASQFVETAISGLANQLYNFPLDFFIESRLYKELPWLSDAQFVSLAYQMQDNQKAVTDRQTREFAPHTILQANQAMNAAMALFVDSLYEGITHYAAPYEALGALRIGRKLYKAAEEALAHWQPGSEYDLVDEWATILSLTAWYVWVPDTAGKDSDPVVEKVSRNFDEREARALAEPEMQAAATMYMVGALKKFAHMEQSDIAQYVMEIAILGQSGLDYFDSTHKYTLRNAPGQLFTGLQLMSQMFVGFKLIDPSLDTGMALDAPYKQALILYNQGM